MKDYFELMPAEFKNYLISSEVGLWGKAPAMMWALVKSLNIYYLTFIIYPNTFINITKQRINNLDFYMEKRH